MRKIGLLFDLEFYKYKNLGSVSDYFDIDMKNKNIFQLQKPLSLIEIYQILLMDTEESNKDENVC